MIQKRYLYATIGILVVFAIGLVGYFEFSAAYGDGLEKVMEDQGVEEADQLYSAPLSYGDNYGGGLLAGLIGFALVLVVVFGYLYLVKGVKKDKGKSN